MVHGGATNEVALSCSSKATGRPHALSRRNTLQVVWLASLPLSGMTSCLAPSPAVMSSLATTDTRSEPLIRKIFLVLPSATSAPSERALECPAVGASTGPSCIRARIDQKNSHSASHHPGRGRNFSTRKAAVPATARRHSGRREAPNPESSGGLLESIWIPDSPP